MACRRCFFFRLCNQFLHRQSHWKSLVEESVVKFSDLVIECQCGEIFFFALHALHVADGCSLCWLESGFADGGRTVFELKRFSTSLMCHRKSRIGDGRCGGISSSSITTTLLPVD